MKLILLLIKLLAILLLIVAIDILTSCKNNTNNSSLSQLEIDSLQNNIKEIPSSKKPVTNNHVIFVAHYYSVFNNQEGTHLQENHARNSKVEIPYNYDI